MFVCIQIQRIDELEHLQIFWVKYFNNNCATNFKLNTVKIIESIASDINIAFVSYNIEGVKHCSTNCLLLKTCNSSEIVSKEVGINMFNSMEEIDLSVFENQTFLWQ